MTHFLLFPCFVVLGLLAFPDSLASAAPLPLQPRDGWFQGVLYPSPGNGSLNDEIECYALPYGGLGFLSHILTFYTAWMVADGRKPLWPRLKLKPNWVDVNIYVVSMIVSVLMAAFSISSCLNTWPLVLVAFWKLMLSFQINFLGLFAVVVGWNENDQSTPKIIFDEQDSIFFGVLGYVLGTVCGATGLFSIVSQTYDTNYNVLIITWVFSGAAALVFIVLYSIAKCNPCGEKFWTFSLPSFGAIFTLLLTFYSDWTLAAIQGRWSGAPSSDVALFYWLYFFAKRLPMLSW